MDQQYQHNHAYDHEDDYHNAINAQNQNQYADSEAEQIHLEHLKNSGQYYDGGDNNQNHHPDDLQVNDQLRQQMTSFEGMNRLAQLAGELDQHSNSNFQQNNQMNGYGNEAYLPDGHEFIEQQEQQLNQQQQQLQQQELYANPNQSRSILGSIPNINNDNQNHYIENGYHNGPNGHLPHNNNSNMNLNSQHAVDLSKSGIKLEPVTLPPLDNVENALKTLAEIKNTMPEDESIADEINCLSKILSRNEFTETLELYNTTVTNWSSPLGVVTAPPEDKENQSNPVRQPSFKQNIEPLTSATDRLVNEVRNNLSIVYQTEAQNLLRLLYMPNFQVLFPTHDEVALIFWVGKNCIFFLPFLPIKISHIRFTYPLPRAKAT